MISVLIFHCKKFKIYPADSLLASVNLTNCKRNWFATPQTKGRMGTGFKRNDFWDSWGGQPSVHKRENIDYNY